MKYTLKLILIIIALDACIAQSAMQELQEADTLFEYGAYQQSLIIYQKATLNFQNSDNNNYLYCKNKSAECLIRIGKLDEAEELVTNSISENPNALPFYRASLQNSIATIYMYKGKIEQALNEARAGINMMSKSKVEKIPELSYTTSELYNTTGLCYWLQGNLENAEEYLLQALEIRKNLIPLKPSSIAAIHNNLGLVYTGNQNKKALQSFQFALKEYGKIYPKNHASVAIAISNIALIYKMEGMYSSSLVEYDKALAIWRSLYSEDHSNKAFVLVSKAQVYLEQMNYTDAIRYCNMAIEMYEKIHKGRHLETASAYMLQGEIFNAQQLYSKALQSFQKVQIQNSYLFNSIEITQNPSANDFRDPSLMLSCMLEKANSLISRHEQKTLKLEDLKLALKAYHTADTLLSYIRKIRTNKKDKINLSKWATELNEKAVDVAFKLYQNTVLPKKYLRECFYFIEKNKGAVLQEAIADAQAKSFSGIPDTLINIEKNIQLKLTWLEQQLLKNDIIETEKENLRNQLFENRRLYENFIKRLERDYPAYYNLKYNTTTFSIEDIQKQLSKEDLVISYLSSENSGLLYRFCITKKDFYISTSIIPNGLNRLSTGFLNSIKFQVSNIFSETNSILSKHYLPKIQKSVKHLIIVADAQLATIPFELLILKQPKNDSIRWSDMDYVAKHFSVSYSFSAKLYHNHNQVQAEKDFLAIAPVEFKGVDMPPLMGSLEEIKALEKIYSSEKTKTYSYEKANKAILFQNNINNFSIIHLATHGMVHPTEPELSCIYFYGNTPEESKLYTGDMYNLSLKNTCLICLSACETGKGQNTKGEGIIGLSRALLYAGANNIVVSYWKVSDEATALLMTHMHKYIKEKNMRFHEALQKAKFHLMNHPSYSAPYYWAPFVLIGE